MNDLNCFYSAKMVILFILMISSTTLDAQRNKNNKFFDLMTTIGEYFRGEFNDAEKVLELDLNGANSFLKGLHTFATREIVRKNKKGEFECKKSKKPSFIIAIKEILVEKSDKNVRNFKKAFLEKSSINELHIGKKLYKKVEYFLKAIIVPKQSEPLKLSDNELYTIKTILDDKSFKKVEDLLKELSVKFSEEQLFNLLFSLAARLEALVHGKNIDGTFKEKEKNPQEKIQTFLAVPKCFILPESELSFFDYWIEIIEMKEKESQKPIFGVAIYKEKDDKWGYSKEKAFELSRKSYETLQQLNDQKFSINETSNLIRAIFNRLYNYGDKATNRADAARLGNLKHISRGKISQIILNLLNQINSEFLFNWKRNEHWNKNYKCAYAMFFLNISENLMEMISEWIDPKLHLESEDKKIQEYIQKDVEESCKKFDKKEAKIIFLNNVRYDLAINFEFNQRKVIYDRAEVLFNWIGDLWEKLSEESYLKKNASQMLRKIEYFTSGTNRESISIIEALIEKEHFNHFNLVSLFDQIKALVEVTIPEEKDNLKKAKKEIKAEQLEKDIKFLKNNPKSFAEEKYQKAVAIICTIKQHGEKVEMLKSKIETFEIKEQLNELSSKIQKNETENFGPELLKQMKESCNQFNQIEMEEIVSEEELLADLQFEFDEIWKSSKGVLGGIEEYFLSIPLMQLTEQARTLAKTFGKMVQNLKEHYDQ